MALEKGDFLTESGLVDTYICVIDSVMFPPSLSIIYEQHCKFLQTLEDRLVNWQWQCVLGDVFARFSDTTEVSLKFCGLNELWRSGFDARLHF